MNKIIRGVIIGISFLMMMATVIGVNWMQSYTKTTFNTDEYSQHSITDVLVSNDYQYYYDYGYLVKAGYENSRCGYIRKYDSSGQMVKSVLIDDPDKQNQHMVPTFLYEKGDVLFAEISTFIPSTGAWAGSIMQLNKEDLTVIETTPLDASLVDMGICDANEEGFLFTNLAQAEVNGIIKMTKTDFKGNILWSVQIPGQISLNYLDKDDFLSAHPEVSGIHTEEYLTYFKVKEYKDKVYMIATIAQRAAYRCKYTGVILCFDNAGNVLWRKEKTPMYFVTRAKEPISRYEEMYIEDDRIFVVGSEGVYGHANELPEDEKGTGMTPIVDEYDINGTLIGTYSFENKNKASSFNKIMKTQDGFLLLGWPFSEERLGGDDTHQKKEFSGLKFDAFIGEVNLSAEVFGDKLIGRVYGDAFFMPVSKTFKDYPHFQQILNILSFWKGVQAHQKKIFVVLGVIIIACLFNPIKSVILKRKSVAEEPTL